MQSTLEARLCSQNAHKLGELQAALPGWWIELLGAVAFPAETGATYYDNARAKAAYGRALGPAEVWMLGEDSGIEVEALGGRPGVESARWAPDGVAALLSALRGVEDRRARYVCELVGLSPSGEELRGTGYLEGRVADAPRGDEGFGYDPILVPAGEGRTVAELGNAWKVQNSHRSRAARDLASQLRRA